MVVELIGNHHSMHYAHEGWRKVVHLALRYGWKPLGAQLPPGDVSGAQDLETTAAGQGGFDESTWSFLLDATHGIPPQHPLAYCSDVLLFCQDPVEASYFDHGRVNAEDARAFAAALEKALPHMPEGPEAFRDHKPGALFNPAEWFNPKDREHFRNLIAFCKNGEFKLVP
jgi:hypothetical protein